MKQVVNILQSLPPNIQGQLLLLLKQEQEQILRQMGQAQGLQDVGRAQGKHEIVNQLVSGLGQVATRGHP